MSYIIQKLDTKHPKFWAESKSTVAAILAMLIPILGNAGNYPISAEQTAELVALITAIVGAGLALYGRVYAVNDLSGSVLAWIKSRGVVGALMIVGSSLYGCYAAYLGLIAETAQGAAVTAEQLSALSIETSIDTASSPLSGIQYPALTLIAGIIALVGRVKAKTTIS